jgi:DNA-binding transcriptional LysR family regulator|tara:strand:- start:121 stop:480 length:360 start_codon:yes stop_codon:yes gene_type:complete
MGSFFPSLLAAFKKDHPQILPFLRSASSWALEQMILDSEIEAALLTRPSGFPDLVYERIREEKVAAFALPLASSEIPDRLTSREPCRMPLIIRKPEKNRISRVEREMDLPESLSQPDAG